MGQEHTRDRGDAELLVGDAEDFGVFYERHEDEVLAFFLRRTRRADLTGDLTAETFARALEGRSRFDPGLGEPVGWLFGIARHVLAGSLRRGRVADEARRRLGMERTVLDELALEAIEGVDVGPALVGLEELPADQQIAVRGRVLDERDYGDLAAQLRCSESVVRQRVSRGLRALGARLKESNR